jgi:hypothetical protein
VIEYPLPDLPAPLLARQAFARPRIADVEAHTRSELQASGVALRAGGRYAIAVGSRGIAQITTVVRTVVDWVRGAGGRPFIVPAMGSHGGAAAQGQRAVLESYGITESAMGAPIVSSMEVVELPRQGLELPTFFDKHASEADGTILINRIKPHTDYHGPVESGLMKMAVIGLGKHRQALAVHERQIRGMVELLPRVAHNVLRHANIVLGVALVENAYDEICAIRALPAAAIADEEPRLLDHARRNMPRLPVEDLDILIIDRIGKNISGVCLDPNIIGRVRTYGFPEPASPRIKIIVIRDLAQASHGNAIGMGLADVMLRRLYDKIDWNATYENLITNTFLDRGKVPVLADDDRQALAIAWRAAGSPPPAQLRMARIVDTLHLENALVSPAVADELSDRSDVTILPGERRWFADRASLVDPWE